MKIYFITGNKNKLKEVRKILSPFKISSLDIDLPEIQELDPHKIIKNKLKEARKHHQGLLFCEDTSIYLKCLNGFPGPLIKWFMQSLKIKGIADLAKKYKDQKATAKTIVGLYDGKKVKYFQGTLKGKIVSPKGPDKFGWDPIFQADGYKKTLAQMTRKQKNQISMRQQALEKMRLYLKKKIRN